MHVPIPFSSPLYDMYVDTCTVHVLVIAIPPSLPLYDIYVILNYTMYSTCTHTSFYIYMRYLCIETCTVRVLIIPSQRSMY